MLLNSKIRYAILSASALICCSCSNANIDTSIAFSQDELHIEVNQNIDVSELVSYSNLVGNITYTIEDDSILSIDGSVVHALKAGSSDLYASSNDVSDSIKVIVSEEKPHISYQFNNYEFDRLDGAFNLFDYINVSPSTSSLNLTSLRKDYSFNGNAITFDGVGNYAFTLTVSLNAVTSDPYNFVIYVYDSLTLNGRGTIENPYLVSTPNDLKILSDAILDDKDLKDKYFLQTNNIDISEYSNWTPIGTFGLPFEGIYNGNDYEVTGLKIETTESWQGLFGFSSGVIKNLTVRGDVKVSCNSGYVYSHSFCAGVCGGLYNAAVVDNCINYVNVHGDAYVGGIVGGIARSDEMIVGRDQSLIVNCKNYGTITGDDTYAYNEQAMYFGGICGESLGILTNNTNYGEVRVSGARTRYVGGVCGLGYTIYKYGMYLDEDLEKYANNDNINYGLVSGYHSVGGVFGGNVLPSHNCINYGTVSGYACVGGISGLNGTASILENNYSVSLLENCKNFGEIYVENRYAGGITSYSYFDVRNCLNDGKVLGSVEAYSLGGIVGYQSYGNVSECLNDEHALIKGYHSLGGIVGHVNKDSLSILDCNNKGEISVLNECDDEAVHVGGIAGILGTNATLKDCHNYGDVTGKGTRNSPSRWGGTGGIAGSIYSSSKIFSSINEGHVYANQQVGGIFGYSSGNILTSVQSCHNEGTISSSHVDPFLGGIAGRINGTSLFNNTNDGILDVSTGATHVGQIYGSAAESSSDGNKVSGDDHSPYFYLFSGGVGSKDDPFQISNTTDFEYLRERISSEDDNASQEDIYFILTNDITITGGLLASKEFNGHFDGNNHSITLNLETSKKNIAIFGINNGTIENLISKGSIKGGSYLAGIALTNNGLIKNCDNQIEISGASRVGGIAVTNYGTIKDCINNAIVSGSSQYIGGIAGVNGDSSKIGIIDGCHNKGNVSSTAPTSLSDNNGNCVGGIVGFSYSVDGTKITDCYNYGEVTSISAIAGIVGFIKTGGNAKLENLYNFGDVIGQVGSDDAALCGHIGGIVGMLGSGVNIKNAFNTGTISGNGGRVTNKWRGVGGIIGSFYNGVIDTAYNFGDVIAKMHAGGIVGYSQGNTTKTITNCISGGSISDENSNAGGILGRGNYTSITDSISFASVTTSGDQAMIYGGGNNITVNNNLTRPGSVSATGLIKDIYLAKGIIDKSEAQLFLDDINALLLTKNSVDDTILSLLSCEEKTFSVLLNETIDYLNEIIGGSSL